MKDFWIKQLGFYFTSRNQDSAFLTYYIASNAGSTTVNGNYTLLGTFSGKNYYIHENGLYYLIYAPFWPNEWDIIGTEVFPPAMGVNKDYYYWSGSNAVVPLTGWRKGIYGINPVPTFTKVL